MASNQPNHQLKTWVATHRATAAAEFIDLLSPVSGILAGPGGLPHSSLYRGVDDTSYLLLPSAFRPRTTLLVPPRLPARPGTNGAQICKELATLIAFIQAADRQGHHIPEDSQSFRVQLKSLASGMYESKTMEEWPPSSLLSVLALAQHYRAATRLLDWSLDPYVAAYFAASEAAKDHKKSGDLAVWAFVTNLFDLNEIFFDKASVRKLPIQYVKVPWATNANARAQRGVFLAHRQFDIELSQPFVPRAYDDVLIESLDENLQGGKSVYCITLSRAKAPELLRLLAFQGYDGATMFPGLDGAVMRMSESRLWPSGRGPDPRRSEHVEIFIRMTRDEGES